MRIPKKIHLAGMTIDVILTDKLYSAKRVIAEAIYPEQKIMLDTTMLSYEGMCQSYCHELLHFIFYILNEDQLRQNEKLVDTTAHLLHQALKEEDYYTEEELKGSII
jgi:hypothetical protein